MKRFTSVRAFSEDVKLLGQLFTLGTDLLGFSSQARHEVSGHNRGSYRSEDTAEQGDELRFDYFDGDVVDETFQSNLYSHDGVSKGDNGSRGGIEWRVDLVISLHTIQSFGTGKAIHV
jgi:hypothetical protein